MRNSEISAASVGERISALRTERNLSQGQLAKELGVSRQAVSKWENDLSSPDTLNLIRLSEVLDTEVEYLATGRKPVYQAPSPAPVIVTVEEKVDKIIARVVEKPVIKKVVRIRYRQNPLLLALVGLVCFALGLLIGLLI